MKKLYVGNLPWSCTDRDLEDQFASFGKVLSARVITDRETGRSRGFGFVEIEEDEGAQRAMSELDGRDFNGRPLRVNEAQERQRGGGGGGGGPRGGGGGGGGRW